MIARPDTASLGRRGKKIHPTHGEVTKVDITKHDRVGTDMRHGATLAIPDERRPFSYVSLPTHAGAKIVAPFSRVVGSNVNRCNHSNRSTSERARRSSVTARAASSTAFENVISPWIRDATRSTSAASNWIARR